MSLSSWESHGPNYGLREFYELIVLLENLGPCIGSRTQGSVRNASIDEHSYTPLRSFLDRLSWICEYEPGGETVTSIAIQNTDDAIVFWLASSHKAVQKAHAHLLKILGLLSGAHDLSARDSYNLEQQISRLCIEFSWKRVKYYSKVFTSLLEKCQRVFQQADLQLSQDLLHLASLEGSHFELCTRADHFRDTESLRRLSQHVSSNTSPSIWSLLRHYIGRLGSWHHASRTLVDYASGRPQIFINFQIAQLTLPRPIAVPLADEYTNLHSVLSRLFTAQEQLELERGIQILQRLRQFDLDALFQKTYRDRNFKPRVHAEVWLLEHFLGQNMDFMDGDRYIGCSKPSCYCCHLYLINRPHGMVERPSHGNVWINWQSPLQQDSSQRSLEVSLRFTMISKFKADFKHQILESMTNYGRVPDTTTGLTLSDT